MKIFLTINLICVVSVVLALIRDHASWYDKYSTDGGWVTHYTVTLKVRNQTNAILAWSGGTLLATWSIGALYLIWSF